MTTEPSPSDSVTIATQQRQIALLSRLSDATALSRTGSPSEVATTMLVEGLSVLGADAGFIGRLLGADALQIVHVAGFAYETRERLLIPLDAPYPLAETVRSDRALFIASNEELRCNHPGLTRMKHADHACATIPLAADGRLLGALNVSYDSPRSFDAADRELLHLFAERCAQAIVAAEQRALKTAAEALAERTLSEQRALDLSDDVVQELAAAKLALELGRNEDGLESVTRALQAAESIAAELTSGVTSFRRTSA
jgi:GAF domain-containing protein